MIILKDGMIKLESDDGPFRTGRKKAKSMDDYKWEAMIEDNLISTGRPGRDRIFASQAGLCERQTAGLFYLDSDEEIQRKASAQFYFAFGNETENIMARAFDKAGVLIDRETRIEAYHDELPISGRIDFVLKDVYDEGSLVLMELKTCGKLPARPKPPHLAQLKVYMLLTGMKKGLLWYVSRTVAGWNGDLKQKTFEIRMNEIERKELAYRISLGAVYAKSGHLPERPEYMKKYACGFCPLMKFCWDDEDIGLVYKKPRSGIETENWRKAQAIANDVMAKQNDLMEYFYEAMEFEFYAIPF